MSTSQPRVPSVRCGSKDGKPGAGRRILHLPTWRLVRRAVAKDGRHRPDVRHLALTPAALGLGIRSMVFPIVPSSGTDRHPFWIPASSLVLSLPPRSLLLRWAHLQGICSLFGRVFRRHNRRFSRPRSAFRPALLRHLSPRLSGRVEPCFKVTPNSRQRQCDCGDCERRRQRPPQPGVPQKEQGVGEGAV